MVCDYTTKWSKTNSQNLYVLGKIVSVEGIDSALKRQFNNMQMCG